MKFVSFAIVISLFTFFASSVSARESAGAADDPAPVAAAPNQNGVTASLSCKKVVVDIDEGYGVSSRETRYDCAPRN